MSTYDNTKVKTKKKIADAFWELYKQKPIEKITIKEITILSQIHRATFYLHYQDIYMVLEEIENHLIHELSSLDSNDYRNSWNDMDNYARKVYEIFERDQEYIHYLIIENREPKFAAHYKERLKQMLPEIFITEGCSKKACDAFDIQCAIIVEMFLQWVDKGNFLVDECIQLIEGIMFRGFFPTMLENFDLKPTTEIENFLHTYECK